MRWDSPREQLDNLDRVIDDIERETDKESVILVEGRRDEEALTKLGIESDIIHVSGNGYSIHETAQSVSHQYSTAIVLTDWDSQGKTLMKKLKKHLEYYGVTPETIYRKRLMNLTSKEVYDVESLVTHRQQLKTEI